MQRLIPFILLTFTLVFSALAAVADTVVPSITVTGEGEVYVTPDVATVNLAVRAEAETTGEALDQASEATQAILAMLAGQGIDAADIQTGAVQLNPIYASTLLSGQRQISGYSAYNSVSVTVKDMDALGGLITAAVNEGANTLSGVEFGLQNPQDHQDAARRLAVADAARRATLYAEAAGVELNGLISLNEQGTGGYRPVMAEPIMAEMSPSRAQYDVPVSAGEIRLSASIVVIYRLAE